MSSLEPPSLAVRHGACRLLLLCTCAASGHMLCEQLPSKAGELLPGSCAGCSRGHVDALHSGMSNSAVRTSSVVASSICPARADATASSFVLRSLQGRSLLEPAETDIGAIRMPVCVAQEWLTAHGGSWGMW